MKSLISKIRSSTKFQFFLVSLGVIFSAIFTSFFSGSQAYTPSYTPDSEFYLTLGMFGNQVNSRAPVDAYYWTKLGLILPMKLMFHFFGPEIGWQIFRLGIITLITSSVALIARFYYAKWGLALFAATAVSLNSVIVFFSGNTYFPGLTLSLMFSLICCTLWVTRILNKSFDKRTYLFILQGTIFAWLLMTNVVGFVFSIFVVLSVYISYLRATKLNASMITYLISLSTVGFFSGIAVFLLAGQLVFSEGNWLFTLLDWVGKIKGPDYATQNLAWLPTATSLLAPIAVLFLTIGYLLLFKKNERGDGIFPLLLVLLPGIFLVSYTILSKGPTLEANFYNALLWPPALVAVVVMICKLFPQKISKKSQISIFVLGLLVLLLEIWVGGLVEPFTPSQILAFSVFTIIVTWIATMLHSKIHSNRSALTLVASIASLLVVMQLAQSSEPQSQTMVWRQPYSSAFQKQTAQTAFVRDITVEGWVLSQTAADDRVLVWLNPLGGETFVPYSTRISPAAMQLWGQNTFFMSGEDLSDWDKAHIKGNNVNKVVTYSYDGQDPVSLEHALHRASIGTTKGECEDFNNQGLSPLRVCILSLYQQ